MNTFSRRPIYQKEVPTLLVVFLLILVSFCSDAMSDESELEPAPKFYLEQTDGIINYGDVDFFLNKKLDVYQIQMRYQVPSNTFLLGVTYNEKYASATYQGPCQNKMFIYILSYGSNGLNVLKPLVNIVSDQLLEQCRSVAEILEIVISTQETRHPKYFIFEGERRLDNDWNLVDLTKKP